MSINEFIGPKWKPMEPIPRGVTSLESHLIIESKGYSMFCASFQRNSLVAMFRSEFDSSFKQIPPDA